MAQAAPNAPDWRPTFTSLHNSPMRILANSVFERIVYHCVLLNADRPSHPMLAVDAVLRDGDADGPLLVAVADFKRMIGVTATVAALPRFRDAGRTEIHDGVEYVAFSMWERWSESS